MNKEYNLSEVVDYVAHDQNTPQATVERILKSAFNAMAANLPIADKGRIEIHGLGTFKLVKHKATKWKLNGNEGITAAHFTVEFKPSPRFIGRVNDNLNDPDGLVVTK